MSSVQMIKRPTEEVPIFQGDDAACIEALRLKALRLVAEAEQAKRRTSGRFVPSDEEATGSAAEAAKAAGREYDAAVAEATPRAVMVTVQALGRKRYRALLKEHPPREDHDADKSLGFNEETFSEALVEFWDLKTGEKTVADPGFDSSDELAGWLDALNDGNFSQLASAAVRVNEGGSPNPKADLSSQLDRMFGATSRSPDSTD